MMIRRQNQQPIEGADLPPFVLILKKTQGSVWSEAGRTPLCPTVGWLHDNYGVGQYELRLKRGNRTLCMTLAECRPRIDAAAAQRGRAILTSWPASGSDREP